MAVVCVYCGSHPGDHPAFLAAARAVGDWLGGHGHRLVYGGANRGLMRALADAALGSGAEVLGVMPEKLVRHGIAHDRLTELRVVPDMHTRKAAMAAAADAFVALPGGMGTLEEVCEAFVWTQLGYQDKPCGLLNVLGFFDPFLAFLDEMARRRFLRPEQRAELVVGDDPAEVLPRLLATQPTRLAKWMD